MHTKKYQKSIKALKKAILLIIFLLIKANIVFSQCSCLATDYGSINVSGWTVGQSGTITTCQYGGERCSIYNTVAGATYLISTCGASFDTQLTIYSSSCTYIAYNDDNGADCSGLAASVSFVSTGGTIYSVMNRYSCTTQSTCVTVTIKLLSFTPPLNIPFAGDNLYTTCSGHLYDNGLLSSYSNNSNGYTVIYPASSTCTVYLTGTYNTESNYDYIRIYDGAGTGGTLLATYTGSGSIIPVESSALNTPLTVQFISDGSVTYSGFDFEISCIDYLPIELSEFTVNCPTTENGQTSVKWSTLSETNNDYFIVWRSYNIADFEKIAIVDGAGNSNIIQEYEYNYFENTGSNEPIYYRLQQVDFDGQSETFDIIYINCESDFENRYIIAPNPSTDGYFSVLGADSLDKIEVFDELGRNTYGYGKMLKCGNYAVFVNSEFIGKLIVK